MADRSSTTPVVDAEPRRQRVDPIAVLRETSVFGGLPREAVAELLPDVRQRSFSRGQVVWLEGDRAESLYVVGSGQLKSYRVSRDGREVILSLHRGVTLLGEVGLFHPLAVRWVNVGAMTASECLVIPREPLLAFLSRHPSAMRGVLQQLSVYAVQAAYSFSGVAFDDIGRRVAGALLMLVTQFGEPTSDGTRIRLRLSQGDLAALVAASRENVNRALSSLVASGVISQRAGHFHVHDEAGLRRAARTVDDQA